MINILIKKYALLKYFKKHDLNKFVLNKRIEIRIFGFDGKHILKDKPEQNIICCSNILNTIKKIISIAKIFCFRRNNENNNYPLFKDKPEQNMLWCCIILDNIKKIISINCLLVKTFQKILLNNIEIRKD
jgi:hypothetical protein